MTRTDNKIIKNISEIKIKSGLKILIKTSTSIYMKDKKKKAFKDFF